MVMSAFALRRCRSRGRWASADDYLKPYQGDVCLHQYSTISIFFLPLLFIEITHFSLILGRHFWEDVNIT